MIVSRRTLLAIAAVTAASFSFGVTSAEAKIVSTEEAMKDLIIGSADAPIEMIEYASLSCPACKNFHDNVYPIIKTEYIDTGKVKFIYRDFPTNTPGLAASMIARCAGPERLEGMVDFFFNAQPQWAHAENPMQALTMAARMAGIGPNEVDTCLKNADLMHGIQAKAKEANEKLGVDATPTIFVAGKKVEHAQDPEKLKAAIEDALKAAK